MSISDGALTFWSVVDPFIAEMLGSDIGVSLLY